MEGDGVRTDDEVPNAVAVERLEKFFVVSGAH
jgi:hypothetical protein